MKTLSKIAGVVLMLLTSLTMKSTVHPVVADGYSMTTSIVFSVGDTIIFTRIGTTHSDNTSEHISKVNTTNTLIEMFTSPQTTVVNNMFTLNTGVTGTSANTSTIVLTNNNLTKLVIKYYFSNITVNITINLASTGSATGINQTTLPKQIGLKVFPNPSTDVLNINTDENDLLNVQLFNITGQLVLDKEVSTLDNNRLDVGSLDRGTYILVVKTERGLVTSKVMLQ